MPKRLGSLIWRQAKRHHTEHAAAGDLQQGAHKPRAARPIPTTRQRGSTCCALSVWPRQSRSISSSLARTCSKPTWPSCTDRRMSGLAKTDEWASSSNTPTNQLTRSNCCPRTASIRSPIWRCRQTAVHGRRNAPLPGAPETQARQEFIPDGSRSFEEIDRLQIGEHDTAI